MKTISKTQLCMKKDMTHMSQRNKKGNKLWQWIKFSRIGSIVPIVFSIGYDETIGTAYSENSVNK